MLSYHENLDLAIGISIKAGNYLLKKVSRKVINFSDAPKDIKLSADLNSEKIILTELKKTASYPILAEESGQDGKIHDNNPYWIVDPLDGTMNYTRNFPMACISIALWQNNEPVLGVVYDFNRKEMYSAVAREDAKLNDEIISVSETDSVEHGILATGFPSLRSYKTEPLNNFIKKVQVFKKIRMIGSAAMSLAYVASGRFDAYFEEDIMIWDVAAGLALVKAAGGEIYIKPGSRKHSVICAATNGKIPITELVH